MVASEHPGVVEGRRRLIVTDVLDPKKEAEDGYIDDGGSASDEEDESGFGEAGVITGVTEVGTKDV